MSKYSHEDLELQAPVLVVVLCSPVMYNTSHKAALEAKETNAIPDGKRETTHQRWK